MISRYTNVIVCFTLFTSLVSCQIAKGFVDVNFNGGYGGNIGKSYEKTYTVEGAHSAEADASLGGAIVKTVEVPAPAVHSSIYFQKQIQPVVVQKQVEYKPIPPPEPIPVKQIVVTKEVVTAPQDVYVRKVYRRPHHPRKHYTYVDAEVAPPRVGFLTKLFAIGAAPAPAPIGVQQTEYQKEVLVPQNTATYSATANVNKNGNLFNDIFNIPISTLRAVNQLVNNVAGGVSVTKQVNTHAVKTVATDVHPNTNANAYVHAEGHVHA